MSPSQSSTKRNPKPDGGVSCGTNMQGTVGITASRTSKSTVAGGSDGTPKTSSDLTVSKEDEQMLKTALAFVVLRRRARGKAARQSTFSSSPPPSTVNEANAGIGTAGGERGAKRAHTNEKASVISNEVASFSSIEKKEGMDTMAVESAHFGSCEVEYASSRKRQRDRHKYGYRTNNGSSSSHNGIGDEGKQEDPIPFLRGGKLRQGLFLHRQGRILNQQRPKISSESATLPLPNDLMRGKTNIHVSASRSILPNPMSVEQHISRMFDIAISTALPLYSHVNVHDMLRASSSQNRKKNNNNQNQESQQNKHECRDRDIYKTATTRPTFAPVYDCKNASASVSVSPLRSNKRGYGCRPASASKLDVLDGIVSHLAFQLRLLVQTKRQSTATGDSGRNGVNRTSAMNPNTVNRDDSHRSVKRLRVHDPQNTNPHSCGLQQPQAPSVNTQDQMRTKKNRAPSPSSIVYDLLLAPYVGRMLVPSVSHTAAGAGVGVGARDVPEINLQKDGTETDDSHHVQTIVALCTILHRMVYFDPSSGPLFQDVLSGLCEVVSSLYHGVWKMKMDGNTEITSSDNHGGKKNGSGCEIRKKTREKRWTGDHRRGRKQQSDRLGWNTRTRDGKYASAKTTSRKNIHCLPDIVAVNFLILMEEIIELRLAHAHANANANANAKNSTNAQTEIDILHNDSLAKVTRGIVHEMNSKLGTGITLPISTQELAGFYAHHVKREQHLKYQQQMQQQRPNHLLRFPHEQSQKRQIRVDEQGMRMSVIPCERRLNAGARIMLRLSVFDLIQKLSCHV